LLSQVDSSLSVAHRLLSYPGDASQPRVTTITASA
jgi:hypothetical protein